MYRRIHRALYTLQNGIGTGLGNIVEGALHIAKEILARRQPNLETFHDEHGRLSYKQG